VNRSRNPLLFVFFMLCTSPTLHAQSFYGPPNTASLPSIPSPPFISNSNSVYLQPVPYASNEKALADSPWDTVCLVEPDPAADRLSGFMGGASFYYVKPFLQNNTSAVITTSPGTPTSLVTQNSFNWNYQPAAAFWLGWTTPSGLGFRARYFFFEEASSTSNFSNGITPAPNTQTTITPPLNNFLPLSTGGTAFGSPGTLLNSGIGTDQLAFGSDLHINALDIEATYAWHGNSWSLLASGGGRYLTLDQGYQAQLVNNGGGLPATELQQLNSTRNFSGGGLVGALQGNVDICHSGFSLFSSIRGSFVVGTTQEHVGYTQYVNDPAGLVPPGIPGTFTLSPQSVRNTDHTMSTIELELGLQYTAKLSWGDIFFRTAVVNQTYFDAGNASQATGNLSLFGVQWSAGLRY
jgi:hypothetical protein